MKREIGGYLELERLTGGEYYPDLLHFNLGRTALKWLIAARGIRRIFLPRFLCESVPAACLRAGCEIRWYRLSAADSRSGESGPSIRPEELADFDADAGDWLYLVNYYGQLTDGAILSLRARWRHIIVDHTHAFFQRPLPGVDTLWSVRKFFGVSDGAYLSTDADAPPPEAQDKSRLRMSHILGRFEDGASAHYQEMLDCAASYEQAPILAMSTLTQNLLGGIDYERARRRRNDNYAVLAHVLASENPFTRRVPDGAFAYPFACENGPALRRALAGQGIYVPTYWKNVLADNPPDSPEYGWAANILPLPVDQRYDAADMEYMAGALLKLL